ncbi:MAG: Ribosomal RNA large subunit methyltransferase H [Opitutia bacterium UBA7350]|nr:MAG: Ribosomal RNA large subunit methyltransferase H [Opitutae bacterium UBA7350]
MSVSLLLWSRSIVMKKMFRYTLIVVGKLKQRALSELCADYEKRLQRQGKLEVVELKDGTVENEGQRILETIEKRREAKLYALAEEGKGMESRAFSKELTALEGRPIIFVIGGAYGLARVVKARADVLLSLSPMTFTHEMARYILSEQLFRADAIRRGSGYHHI